MMTKKDLETHINIGAIDAITSGNDAIINTAITAAQTEAQGYLSAFDFDKVIALRHPALELRIKDICAWHFICLANPNVNLELFRSRYEDAIAWLGKIQAGKIAYKEFQKMDGQSQNSGTFRFTSNPKRINHY
ncbi:MAG: DUF1320 domain-containing protein [Sphingobacteriaceae bacterium]|nr:DUF1320 domain-containing protein [Sphingobacteriaceae bacterium]